MATGKKINAAESSWGARHQPGWMETYNELVGQGIDPVAAAILAHASQVHDLEMTITDALENINCAIHDAAPSE